MATSVMTQGNRYQGAMPLEEYMQAGNTGMYGVPVYTVRTPVPVSLRAVAPTVHLVRA